MALRLTMLPLLMLSVTVASASVERTDFGLWPYPKHASCEMNVTFPTTSCKEAKANILRAASQMGIGATCGRSQACNYKVVDVEGGNIYMEHRSPWMGFVDNVRFHLWSPQEGDDEGGTGCKATAKSESATRYAMLDFGTNYCNIENLLGRSKLDYNESTENKYCTEVRFPIHTGNKKEDKRKGTFHPLKRKEEKKERENLSLEMAVGSEEEMIPRSTPTLSAGDLSWLPKSTKHLAQIASDKWGKLIVDSM